MTDISDHLTAFTNSMILVLVYAIIIGFNILFLLSAAGKWKIYTKAGVAGWKSLIPLYSNWIDFRIAQSSRYFPFYLLCMSAGYALSGTAKDYLMIIGTGLILTGLLISSISYYRLSAAFGYGPGFALGLIFLNPLFIIILGFGRSRYRYDKDPGKRRGTGKSLQTSRPERKTRY